MDHSNGLGILKTHWEKSSEGSWKVTDLQGLELVPAPGCEPDFFTIKNCPQHPQGRTIEQRLQSMNPASHQLQQSIMPVVAAVKGAPTIEVIGTAFVIRASGIVMTAGHVLMDPEESGYGGVAKVGGSFRFGDDLSLGVIFRRSPTSIRFAPFTHCAYWGGWKESPLFHKRDRIELDTDVAICRLPPFPAGAYQPLNLSLRQVEVSEKVFAIGYAEMQDIPVRYEDGRMILSHFRQELHVSAGFTTAVHSNNQFTRAMTMPGPGFEFNARIPGKMSGSPILGGDGAVIRGVVSKSFSGERRASGAMLGPATQLPIFDNKSIKDMMLDGSEGIPQILGAGL